MDARPLREESDDGGSGTGGEGSDASAGPSSRPAPAAHALLVAPRHYSSGDDEDADGGDDGVTKSDAGSGSADSSAKTAPSAKAPVASGGVGGGAVEKRSPPAEKKVVLPTLDAWLKTRKSEPADADASRAEVEPSPSPSHENSMVGTPVGTPGTTPSPKKRKRKQPPVAASAKPAVKSQVKSMEDMDLSVEALREVAIKHGLDVKALDSWQKTADGRLSDPEQATYKTLRDALRVLVYGQTGRIPREDIYFLAILRRKLAEAVMPFQDGPISVLSLGRVVPKDLFHSQKKLFPVGFECIASVRLVKAGDAKIRLTCKIVEGNNQKSPIFVVAAVRNPDVMFRSYVGTKAWKKAIGHFESLSADDLALLGDDSDADETEYLSSSAGEDGFGLLRRNIARIIEGGHQALQCSEYQFWEERHPVSPEAHLKLRSRLLKQFKEVLRRDDVTKEEIRFLTMQEAIISEYEKSPEQVHKEQQQRERERREAEKQSVRDAARKLLEIEMKAHEDAKEAQRKEREDRKNAMLEAKLELVRQKEARKDAVRREKEEERRMREEEREMRKFMKEEEKRRKVEEKEMHMQQKIDDLRERRRLREQQKVILESGVLTARGAGTSGRQNLPFSPSKEGRAPREFSVEKQRAALLKFVQDERERRRRLKLFERRREIEESVWRQVKADYDRHTRLPQVCDIEGSRSHGKPHALASRFPREAFTRVESFNSLSVELHEDVVFIWDAVSTFSDVLQIPFVPPLNSFVDIVVQSVPPSASSSHRVDEAGYRSLSAVNTGVLRSILEEYFHALQMGTSVDEFLRTRPLNLHTWPEIARQVCLLALESTHPSSDDQVVKAIKGSRSNRDDPVLIALRQRLVERGKKLLAGEVYEDVQLKADATEMEKLRSTSRSTTTLLSSATHYGVVAEEGLESVFDFDIQDGRVVVTQLLFQKKVEHPGEATTPGSTGDFDKINVGDYVLAINGVLVATLTTDQDFRANIGQIAKPHGLLMSSTPPPSKPTMKHIPTTHSANKLKRCAYVLKVLRSKEIAEPFNQPVDAELYPDYYSAIPEPMDLGTIQEKIEDEEYENDDEVEAFVDDVNLVWKNCYAFNSMKAEISLMAKKLSAVFDRLMEEWVESDIVRPLVLGEEDHCRMCRTDQVRDRLLVCDRCDALYHTFCLFPPLKNVPSGEWYCPRCLSDPSFVPEAVKRKASDGEKTGVQAAEVIEYTELEKKLLQAIEYLSREDVKQLGLQELVAISRVLVDLLLQTGLVEDLYKSIEEKANALRRECGDSLGDLLHEWDEFAPPKVPSGVDCTQRFIIDGTEHELTDQLLNYLEEKTLAERDEKPIPELPGRSPRPLVLEGDADEAIDTSDVDSLSSEDEVQLLEELGDSYLASVSPDERSAHNHPPAKCNLCHLEDGIVNGPLKSYKQSPLSFLITEIDDFTLPPILARFPDSTEEKADETPKLLNIHELQPHEIPAVRLLQSSHGVRFVSSNETGSNDDQSRVVYCVNDCLVAGMSRDEVAQVIRTAMQPVRIFSADASMIHALHASVSIISFPRQSSSLGVDLGIGPDSFIFVRALTQNGLAELSDQVFPGDVLWMVNGVEVRGRSIEEVMHMLDSSEALPRSLIVVREPSTRMKGVANLKSLNAVAVGSKRTRLNEFLTQVANNPLEFSRREFYDVTFRDGPLGLALALEGRVIVKSLNDNADGTPGQASLSGAVQAGDVIELVNGRDYGVLRDLSQFTATLVTLPRPIVIRFSRVVSMSPAESAVQASDAYSDQKWLGRRLGLRSSTSLVVKTISVTSAQLSSLPLLIEDFGINMAMITSTQSSFPTNVNDSALLIGDRLVGVNGCSTSGLSWETVSRALFQVRGSLHLHFAERVRLPTLLHAHDSCVHQANSAWSTADTLRPKILKARRVEALIKHLVPRSMCFGKCSSSNLYYRFHGDRCQIYVRTPESEWLVLHSAANGFHSLLSHLETSVEGVDNKLASRIRQSFPQLTGTAGNRDFELEPFLHQGPFALKTEVKFITDTGEGDKLEAHISYLGRRYLLGVFGSRQDADAAIKRGEQNVRETGVHTSTAIATGQQLLSMAMPSLKAEASVRRLLQRRYEYSGVVDAAGQPKRIQMSQSVVQSLRRGMHGGGSQLGYSNPSSGGQGVQQRMLNNVPGGSSLNHSEYYKRKLPDSISSSDVNHRLEAQKRAKSLSSQGTPSSGPYPSPQLSPSEVAKRHLQPMADHGRAMLTAWNNYARSSTPQHTQALAFACVTSFEEVKKATTRLMGDPNHPVPDRHAFVCLHHAFVVGLICAMTTQALTNSHRTNGDSIVVKAIADAFATALLCCIGPTPMVRGRAISGFATVVKQCERAMRPHDLSEPLHHIANFIVQFVQVSRYLAAGSFDEMTQCRPVVSEDPRAMEMLPASFVQQIRVLENVRRAFVSRTARSVPQPPSAPTGIRSGGIGRVAPNGAHVSGEQLSHVDFGPGPLGIMINYSTRGKLVVTEYSSDRGQLGQAQASGKVSVGDEVFAINGRLVESIGGMEGFKAIVASGVRPIRVSFKATPESLRAPGRSLPNIHRQLTPPPISQGFGYPVATPGSVPPQLEPTPLAPSSNAQQMMYNGGATMGGLPQMIPRSVYQQQPAPHNMASSHGFSSSSFRAQGNVSGYDSLPVPYASDSMSMTNMAAAGGWQQQAPQAGPFSAQPLMPAPLNPRIDGNTFGTPPPFPRSSASMGFPSPPDLSAIQNRPPLAPTSMPPPYGAEFVAPNDQNSLAGDSNTISFYDANGTTFRSTPDFEIDTTATSASSVIGDETSTVEGNESILDADTEEEGDESALNSGSVSQMTTPANSDVESDTDDHRNQRGSGALEAKGVPANLSANQAPLEVAPTVPSAKSGEPRRSQPESIDVDEDMNLSMARRSARVPRKITTNIADMYNPELNGSARGRGSSTTPGQSEIVEPTHGEVGELATELLEDFPTSIRSSKTDVSGTLQLLRAQLLTMEATIPRDAFRAGKWSRDVRAAWGEMVFSCDSATALMEAMLVLESNIENDWLDPCWKSASLPTARYAITTATIASAAMRLYAFDDAVSYVRVKRGGGRRKQPQQRSGANSEQSSPVKVTTIDLTSSGPGAMHPLDLAFVSKLRRGTIDVANVIVDRVLSMQRDKNQNVVAHRQAMRELTALTDLNDDQIDQWIRAAANQAQQAQQVTRSQPPNVSSSSTAGNASSSTRQPTPKRKAGGGGNDLPGSSSDARPNRKRKAAAPQRASLPCYQPLDTSSAYRIPASGGDPTLRARLEVIVGTLLKNELALPFAAPVNVRDVPGYTDVIEQPMDLGTIQRRLSRGFYDGRFELVSQDVNLVWTNCFRYNRVDSEISKCANRLRSIYNRLFEHWISNQAPGTAVASLPSEEACRTCQQSHASDRMLLCDSCDAAYHLFCLSPPLAEIPSGDWYCPRCPIQQVAV